MIEYVLALLLVLTCGAADRVIGWGEWGRTKPVLATVAALAALAWGLRMPWPAVATFPLAFMVWRTPAWTLFGGSINPAPGKAAGTFARHLVSVVFLAPAYLAHVSLVNTLVCMIGFAMVATVLAVWNYFNRSHANQTIEFLRGLSLGVALVLAFVVLR